ncbi:hypothetical protein M378DRAFT_811232 [Amanita muscaria Koide BX008]|uniref:Uncharacterized protein n=1 Tax=Amanita muscaria (strain Koide BX008) TaxID=946122 RepID=A0A0C2WYP4_AMAMK|nr:hypothetical protein M378DRAFT_811232 [Amanita muscaria Koide BX008]
MHFCYLLEFWKLRTISKTLSNIIDSTGLPVLKERPTTTSVLICDEQSISQKLWLEVFEFHDVTDSKFSTLDSHVNQDTRGCITIPGDVLNSAPSLMIKRGYTSVRPPT